MMTPRSHYKSGLSRGVKTLLVTIAVVVVGLLVGAYVRDGAVLILNTTDEARRYALLPRAVLIERLIASETELTAIRYQSILYGDVSERLATLSREMSLQSPGIYLTARVISAPPKTHYDTLLIAAGENAGVRLGDLVTVHGVAFGTVTDVSSGSSLVELYSSPGATHDAYVGDSEGIVVIRGVGGGALETSIPNDLDIAVGDTVTDSKTGYVFGVVSDVLRREIDTSALVRISLAAPPNSLRYVSLTHPSPL